MRRFSILMMCLAACHPTKGATSAASPAKTAQFSGPMPVSFGACADVTTRWESGPKPMPDAPGPGTDPGVPSEEQDPPAQAEAPDQAEAPASGQGQSNDDPQLARQQAIEAAREAGVLGNAGAGPVGDRPAVVSSPPAACARERAPLHTAAGGNPLQPEQAALAACFRESPAHYGAAVIELHYDPAGDVSSAEVYGLSGDAARACVSRVARQIKRAAAGPVAQRCSLAFGEMPASEWPALDVADRAITFGGTSIALPESADASAMHGLVAAIAARRGSAGEANAAVVSMRTPIVVRPAESTPMKILYPVMNSLVEGCDDFVLASQHGAGWQLSGNMTLPVVPVPAGTGGPWYPVKTADPSAKMQDERVTLSLLVAKDRVWVGLSRVNEFQAIPRGPGLARALAAELARQKMSAFFADRTDIEIAGEDDVTYGELAEVVAAASAAGFTDWRIALPAGLSAVPRE